MFGLAAVVLLSIHILSMQVPTRREVCPGSTFFIKHGERASWTSHKRLLCTIGAHDFYGGFK